LQRFPAHQTIGWNSSFKCFVRGAEFFDDEKHLITCGDDGNISIWNLETGELTRQFGVAAVYSQSAGRPKDLITLRRMPATALALTEHDRSVAVVMGQAIYVWDVARGEVARQIGPLPRKKALKISELARKDQDTAAEWTEWLLRGWLSMDERAAEQAIRTGEIELWSEGTGEAIRSFAVSPDGDLAAASNYDALRTWRLETKELVFEAPASGALTFSPDGKYLAASEFWGNVSVWRLADKQRVSTLPISVTYASFTADGKRLVVTRDSKLELWSIEPPRLLASYPEESEDLPIGGIAAFAFAPEANVAAFAWSRWKTTEVQLVKVAD
jgi:WD40 repeat protein